MTDLYGTRDAHTPTLGTPPPFGSGTAGTSMEGTNGDCTTTTPRSTALNQDGDSTSAGKRKSGDGEEDMPELIRQILAEPWMQTHSADNTVQGVLQTFAAIIDSVPDTVHGQLCEYIVRIHR